MTVLAEVVPCLRVQSHGEKLSLLSWACCCPNMLTQTFLFSSMAHQLKNPSICLAEARNTQCKQIPVWHPRELYQVCIPQSSVK